MNTDATEEFTTFFFEGERRLRMALTGAFGVDDGREATADALAWAWQNWDNVRTMGNPIGYLYKVGRSSALRRVRHTPDGSFKEGEAEVHPSLWEFPDYEPNLAKFLAGLSESQRVAVWLVHGLGFSHGEVAEVLGCSRPTVATHVRRGLFKLRSHLGVNND